MESPRLKITEIFHSIQGESTLAGERFTFVRTTGCPLRCTYCDTTYSYSGGKWMTVDEIVAEVESHGTRWVCLTGGEPLAQKNALPLVQALRARGKEITIETDGEEDIGPYGELARIIMDIKTPASGECSEEYLSNLPKLRARDEVKFVICDRGDYDWAKNTVAAHGLTDRCTVLFSPAFGGDMLRSLAEWIVADRLSVRLQTQLHKHIWGTDIKGV